MKKTDTDHFQIAPRDEYKFEFKLLCAISTKEICMRRNECEMKHRKRILSKHNITKWHNFSYITGDGF